MAFCILSARWSAMASAGLALAGGLALAAPATQPARDEALDWMLNQSSTAPAGSHSEDVEHPATQPGPALRRKGEHDSSRHGLIALSNGERVRGSIATTEGKPLRVFDEKTREYRDVPFFLVRSIRAKVVHEWLEREWKFKESGSDIKEYSGKSYPAREMQYTLTLLNGQSVTGAIDAPLYVEAGDSQVLFILHKRDKGEIGATLKQLVYVENVTFDETPNHAPDHEGQF